MKAKRANKNLPPLPKRLIALRYYTGKDYILQGAVRRRAIQVKCGIQNMRK
jgi:hypothetical protein